MTPFPTFEAGCSREWLISNGLGGYASSTAIGANTRAYHGLLVASLSPPTDRTLLLSSLDEELNGTPLSNHQYPGAVHPQGFKFLDDFSLAPLPVSLYRVGDSQVEKTVSMIHGENTVLVRYRLRGQGRMRVVPLLHCRSFHAASGLPEIRQEPSSKGTAVLSKCRLTLLSDKARFTAHEDIYRNFEYREEHLRGLAWREDLFCPGSFDLDFQGDTDFSIMASIWRTSLPDVDRAIEAEKFRLQSLKAPIEPLARAADTFVVRRGGGTSIIAGYHWFDDWGRDAMIALPGLLLVTGRFGKAKEVLKTFAGAMRDGILPNDLGAVSYNTVDASLWFVRAAHSHFRYTGDREFLVRLWPALTSVVRRYSGEGEGFSMDGDGLIISGPALTWMDARVDGRAVTGREGKACEINALWYESLLNMAEMAAALDEPWDETLAGRVQESYQRFWNAEKGCLFDVLDHEDASVRPNQIFAAAVPGLLPLIKRRSIVEVVTRELLTPYGLRTLSPQDPRYIGRYRGGPRERDLAYHQGTVWPWLMGPYIRALVSVADYPEESRQKARELLMPLLELDFPGIGTVPEVFDGDLPQSPGGCISQAWSVAELLRAWHEDVQGGPADAYLIADAENNP